MKKIEDMTMSEKAQLRADNAEEVRKVISLGRLSDDEVRKLKEMDLLATEIYKKMCRTLKEN